MGRRLAWAGLAALSVLVAGLGSSAEGPADLVLMGRVWTADAGRPWAGAVATRAGRIVYVGSREGAKARTGKTTRVLDVGSRLVLPGFNDAHIHLIEGALSLERVDLIEEQSLPAVQARIREFAAAHPRSAWVLGRGWLYGSFPRGLPTKEQLDAVVPDRPAYMACYDGHSGWVNSKALALLGIDRSTPDPPSGVIVRDPRTGEPTGALKEKAAELVEARLPVPSRAETYELLLRAFRLLASQGITSIQDAGGTIGEEAADLALLDRAEREGKLTVRVATAIRMEPGRVDDQIALARRLTAAHGGPWLRFGVIKAYVDGVVEARTAAMIEPYPGDPLTRGIANWEPAALDAAVVAASAAGLQVRLHAIGDRGVRMALDAHEAARRASRSTDSRGRIEHIETVAAADYPRFRALGVIASMQPLHANPDQNNEDVWSKNAGPDRASRGFSWGNLERAGARLAFGSDWPVVTSDVMRGLYCAVTRKTREGKPAAGWLPQQAVSLESALRHYTIDGAYASFEEEEKGSLAVGKRADLVVLSRDLFREEREAILRARPLLTMVEGRVVFEDPELVAASGPTRR